MSLIDEFFKYAVDRETIRIKKESGEPAPWTTDPILQEFRFCNVSREDDKVTRWFRNNIREPLKNSPHLFLATVAFRWFNRIEIGSILLDTAIGLVGNPGNWDSKIAKEAILHRYPKGPWTTGSYIVMSPRGMNKLDGILQCIDNVAEDAEYIAERMVYEDSTMEGIWETLQTYPLLGPFMAYELVCDFRHCHLLEHATDKMTWANPGPGAARGIGRIYYGDHLMLSPHSKNDRVELIERMRELLELSKQEKYWPWSERPWELREVEHTLCEFDKYQRVKLGQGRPRQKGNYYGNR